MVAWIRGLPDEEFGRAEFYIDLFGEKGVHLDEPYTRQLDEAVHRGSAHGGGGRS